MTLDFIGGNMKGLASNPIKLRNKRTNLKLTFFFNVIYDTLDFGEIITF